MGALLPGSGCNTVTSGRFINTEVEVAFLLLCVSKSAQLCWVGGMGGEGSG